MIVIPHTRTLLLACMFAALCANALCAHAQDPAAVGGHYDPAFVGGRGIPPRQAPSDTMPPPTEDSPQSGNIENLEALFKRVQTQLDDTTGSGAPPGTDEVERYRSEVEGQVREHWNTLSPQTRELYANQYGRARPDDFATSTQSSSDSSPGRTDLLRGPEDTRDAMRGLESLLLPMLQDLRQAVDVTLQQSANRR